MKPDTIAPETIAGYQRAVEMQRNSTDGKILVNLPDLDALLSFWRYHAEERPRIRRQARSEARKADWIENRFMEVK